MEVNVTQPGLMPFSALRVGQLFKHAYGIYVKSSNKSACVIHKTAGMMNAGLMEEIDDEVQVVRVAKASFTLG